MMALRWWLNSLWQGFKDWILGVDSCDLCGNERSDYTCCDCDRRICDMCESGYYEDENLCVECRGKITPEDEEEDIRLALEEEGDDEQVEGKTAE